MTKPIWVKWCPKDALDGMQTLGPWEELAYRRVLDLIYATGDNLPDDDRKMGWMTKVGSRWPSIKKTLIEDGKIAVSEGRITNHRCRDTLEKCQRFFDQKVVAGQASYAKRKSLENNKTTPTDVPTPEPTCVPTNLKIPDIVEKDVINITSKKKLSDPRGTRLPVGMELPAEWEAFAIAEQHPDPQREWATFTDYWLGKAGQGGVKLDWQATWRNWVRRSVEHAQKFRGSREKQPTFAEQIRSNRTATVVALAGELEAGRYHANGVDEGHFGDCIPPSQG